MAMLLHFMMRRINRFPQHSYAGPDKKYRPGIAVVKSKEMKLGNEKPSAHKEHPKSFTVFPCKLSVEEFPQSNGNKDERPIMPDGSVVKKVDFCEEYCTSNENQKDANTKLAV
jgi:hypothetical protein